MGTILVRWQKRSLCGAPLKGSVSVEMNLRRNTRCSAHIEFNNFRYHDDRLWPMSVLEEGEPERFCPIDEETTATVLLVLNNPIAVAVLADKEEVRSRRGRFLLAHDMFPSLRSA